MLVAIALLCLFAGGIIGFFVGLVEAAKFTYDDINNGFIKYGDKIYRVTEVEM